MARGLSSLLSAAALALGVVSCTFLSGVESLEVGTGVPADGGTESEGGTLTPADGGTRDGAASGGVCNALGSWQECDGDSVVDCNAACAARGRSCVESCCARDANGEYAANIGGLWPATVCAVRAVDANTSGASALRCGDPIRKTGALVMCCCR